MSSTKDLTMGRECRADDDADRHVDHVAAKRKFLEFREHRRLLERVMGQAPSLP
jgi:hypothetical protein